MFRRVDKANNRLMCRCKVKLSIGLRVSELRLALI